MAGISSLGVGSGLDLNALVSNLVEAERAPVATRLAQREQDLNAELSAFGLLRSSLNQFQTNVQALQSSSAFAVKSVQVGDATVLGASAENSAATGSYTIEVEALAQAHSLASNSATAFASIDDIVGSGTLSIRFGTTTTGPYGFTPDPDRAQQDIVVSAANNNTSLSGLRDYINAGDYGLQASIVNDGNGYRLLLTSEKTGAMSSMELTVTGDGDGDDNDNGGLSQLAFNSSAQTSMSQTVKAQDAALTINGLSITRDSNSVSGAIEGVTLDLLKADPGTPITLTIDENRSEITARINDFVTGYNELQKNIDALTAYNAESGTGSVLIGDFTVRSIESRLRGAIFGNVSGLQGEIRSLVDIGITTNSNGTLDVDNSKLQQALLDHGDEVEALFTRRATTTDDGVAYLTSTGETSPGTYAVNVNALATRGILTASGTVNSLQVQDDNNNLTLTVDGVSSGSITLTSGVYASAAALANEIQIQINASSALVSNGVSVSVSYDAPSDRFVITSDSYGSGSSIEITAVDLQSSADFGFTVGAGTVGTDIDGSIESAPAAAGSGQILTSQGRGSSGLSLEILTGGTGARGTVTITDGLAESLSGMLDQFLQSDGFIATREDGINRRLEDIGDDRISLEDRIAALEARLVRQFAALDSLVAQFNQTSNFLSQQLASLPQPGSRGNGS